jgi:hypothetical protein
MAQQRKRKAGEPTSTNGDHHAQPVRSEAAAVGSSATVGNGARSPHLHASIAALAYELYERRGRADGFDVEDWLKAEELIASQAAGA